MSLLLNTRIHKSILLGIEKKCNVYSHAMTAMSILFFLVQWNLFKCIQYYFIHAFITYGTI